jgi:DNA repair protein RecN (Recombination protein N)
MLGHIQIRNFAIIDAVEVEFAPGLTVLTGETGAGKSILVDALLLAAGGRAAADVVRHGADRAEVSATFTISGNTDAEAWFAEQAIDHDGDCVLRRTVGRDGRSRAWVNGQSMPVQALRQLGELLLDVHGQMEYQSLMRRAAQRSLLDRHGDHEELARRVATLWQTWKSSRTERDAMLDSAADRTSRLDLLRYHAGELDALDLKPGEPAALLEERQRVSQRGRLVAGTSEIGALLDRADEQTAEQQLARAASIARTLAALDDGLAPVAGLLDEALISAREAAATLARYVDTLDADPSRQEWVESRLAAIEALARKHRAEPSALCDLQRTLHAEIGQLESLDTNLDAISRRVAQAQAEFLEACDRLTVARRRTAEQLSEDVSALMQGLGMPGGRFEVAVTPLDPEEAGEQGRDAIEFLVSANPGQPPKPLAKIASGGELSRISLAIQVAAIQAAPLPCLVFDEVDAGVGGGVAEIVGRQLRLLGERSQVLCVTHLPQVASQAHQHLRVTKLTDGRTTRTAVASLGSDERIEEIARMLGGVDVTDKAREHAGEMLASASRPTGRTSGARRRRRAKG